MRTASEWKRAMDVTSVEVGDKIVSACGVEIEVVGIVVMQLHFPSPTVLVKYTYNDNGRKGQEQVSLANFYNNIHS